MPKNIIFEKPAAGRSFSERLSALFSGKALKQAFEKLTGKAAAEPSADTVTANFLVYLAGAEDRSFEEIRALSDAGLEAARERFCKALDDLYEPENADRLAAMFGNAMLRCRSLQPEDAAIAGKMSLAYPDFQREAIQQQPDVQTPSPESCPKEYRSRFSAAFSRLQTAADKSWSEWTLAAAESFSAGTGRTDLRDPLKAIYRAQFDDSGEYIPRFRKFAESIVMQEFSSEPSDAARITVMEEFLTMVGKIPPCEWTENQRSAYETVLELDEFSERKLRLENDKAIGRLDIPDGADKEYLDSLSAADVTGADEEEIAKAVEAANAEAAAKAEEERARRQAEQEKLEKQRQKAEEEERERLRLESEAIVKAREEANAEAKAFAAGAIAAGCTIGVSVLTGLCRLNKSLANDRSPAAERFRESYNSIAGGRTSAFGGMSFSRDSSCPNAVSMGQLAQLYGSLKAIKTPEAQSLRSAVRAQMNDPSFSKAAEAELKARTTQSEDSSLADAFHSQVLRCSGITDVSRRGSSPEYDTLAAAYSDLTAASSRAAPGYSTDNKLRALRTACTAAENYLALHLNGTAAEKPADWRPSDPEDRKCFNSALSLLASARSELKRFGMPDDAGRSLFAEQCRIRQAFDPEAPAPEKVRNELTARLAEKLLRERLNVREPLQPVLDRMLKTGRTADILLSRDPVRLKEEYMKIAAAVKDELRRQERSAERQLSAPEKSRKLTGPVK